MKEVFEKIRERLEIKLSDTAYEKATENVNKDYIDGLSMGYMKAIAILNQEEEELGNSKQVNKHLDSLHEKILKSKFAEEVTELEIDALVKAKQSLANDVWIPCSERLPIENDKVLAMDENGIMAVCYFITDETDEMVFKVSWDWEVFYDVIAWQPLPEPHKP